MEKELSLIIPAYNEEKRIHRCLTRYTDWLSINVKNSEIIVVCDGNDATPQIAKKFGANVISFDHRIGKGSAIIEGMKKSKGRWVAFIDADDSVDSPEFAKLWREREKWDIIIGSRHGKGASIKGRGLLRNILSSLFNLMVNLLFGLGLDDTQCGAKLMRRKKVIGFIDKIERDSYDFDVELLIRAKKNGLSIKNIPVHWVDVRGTHLGMLTPFSMGFRLFEMYFEHLS